LFICFCIICILIVIIIRSSLGGQSQRGGVRVSKSLFRHNGRHFGRAERDDRRHGFTGHRLPDQRAVTANHVRRRGTTRTSQGMDSDERHGPRRQSGKRNMCTSIRDLL